MRDPQLYAVLVGSQHQMDMYVVPWGGAFGFACYESRGWGLSGLTSLSDFRNCPSPFKRKKEKQGTNVRHESQQHQPGRKAPTYEDVPEFPVYATVSKPKSVKQDDSIHYADIQVFTKVRERSAAEVKNLQMQNATEYATLNFPRPRLKYDSKNGTLV
ncbi:PREDICTED: uncharacterized protein C11orf52 homolog [Leptosomus discolor]|uniref:uncharacterized protein C11orf52 homolog n=1 Tax=Leptosomus discolor TaxID=188344 RepID=UPI0005229878|nr:PREDICTED: uncharacterized protein C11orf52 homolog [Leptosomus discolor]